MPDIAFNFDENNKNLEICLKGSGLLFSIINEQVVRELIAENFPDVCILDLELQSTVDEFLQQYKEAIDTDSVEIHGTVAEYRDADVEISISDDKMSASAKVTSAYGGEAMSLRNLALAVQKSGVKKGLSKEQLIRLVNDSAKGKPGDVFEREIARGRPPRNGRDTKFEQLTLSTKDRILRPQTLAGGKVDMRDLGAIISVRKGEVLMRRQPPTEGVDGYNVIGEEISARSGDDVKMNSGEGTSFSPKDENILVATRVGVPKLVENGMVVDEILQLPKVDVKSGHVKFDGAVVITGDVSDGMKIIAQGDVTIAGFVDSAFVESGGDVIVQQAIIGRQTKNEELTDDDELTARIHAKGEIHAKFAQYAELEAGKAINMQNQLLHCRVTTPSVWVGTATKANGKVIGGCFRLEKELKTGVLGAPAGSRMQIDFADALQPYERQSEQLLDKITVAKDELDEAKTEVSRLKKQADSDGKKEQLEQLVGIYKECFDEYGQLVAARDVLQLEREKMLSKLTVEATERVYPGVNVEIYKDRMRTAREYGPSRFLYEYRKTKIEPLID